MKNEYLKAIKSNGLNLHTFQELHPMSESGKINTRAIVEAINKSLGTLKQLENDKARSPFEKANFAQEVVKRLSVVGSQLESWVDKVNIEADIASKEFDNATKGNQDSSMSFLLATKLKDMTPAELSIQLRADTRWLAAANAVPEEVSGVNETMLINANTEFVEKNHPDIATKIKQVRGEGSTIDSLSTTLGAVQQEFGKFIDTDAVKTAAQLH